MNAKNLRKLHSDDPRRKFYVKPDLTLKQQETEKALLVEVKRRRELGEDVVIKKGVVVMRSSRCTQNL